MNKDATLGGTGSVAAAVTLKTGATLQAGDTLVVGRNTLNIKGKLTVQKNGILNIPLSLADETKPKINTLVLSGGASFTQAILNLDIQDATHALNLPVGTELKVLAPQGTVTGSISEIQPATPGEGKQWDTTDLLKKGMLRVIADESDGIGSLQTKEADGILYDLNGHSHKASSALPGIYIQKGKKIKR